MSRTLVVSCTSEMLISVVLWKYFFEQNEITTALLIHHQKRKIVASIIHMLDLPPNDLDCVVSSTSVIANGVSIYSKWKKDKSGCHFWTMYLELMLIHFQWFDHTPLCLQLACHNLSIWLLCSFYLQVTDRRRQLEFDRGKYGFMLQGILLLRRRKIWFYFVKEHLVFFP